MADDARVLKIPRSDVVGPESCVLVHVSSAGPLPLDLKLIGTEGSNPYATSIKASRLHALRAKNYHGDDDEWEAVLSALLLRKGRAQLSSDASQGLEMIAAVKDEEDITLTIRKNIDGITQRLGVIILAVDQSQEIELFDWTSICVTTVDAIETEVQSLNARYQSQEKTITKLKSQLEDLVQAKLQHESEMLEKFRDLLNEKKLKIRDQQRLLKDAHIDPAKAAAVRSARQSGGTRNAEPSRPGKRKAGAGKGGSGTVDEESEEDGFEDMVTTANRPRAEDPEERLPQKTPSTSEEETTDEGEDNYSMLKPRPGLDIDSKAQDTDNSQSSRALPAQRQHLTPPPKRDLPFLDRPSNPKLGTQQSNVKDTATTDTTTRTEDLSGSETEGETDDDEL
ncbi:MAG: hypothetical protein M1817_003649 [Caeruleum heppii]|nr:MAG: hypothetical protein M1817_003649 [Caeruleum heppii]